MAEDDPQRYEANFAVSVKSLGLEYTVMATVVIGGVLSTSQPVNGNSKNNIELKISGIQPQLATVKNLEEATTWIKVRLATIMYSPRRQLKFKPGFKWKLVK